MKLNKIVSLLLLTAFAMTAFSQTAAEVEQNAPPRKKEKSRFAFKISYDTPDLNFRSRITSDIDWGGAVGVARNSMVGFSLKIPLGYPFYIQPEALVGLTTEWNGARMETGFFNQMVYAVEHRISTNLDVPFYIGAQWYYSKMFRARGYIGPRFHLAWVNQELYNNFSLYDLTVGGGIDLLNIISVDLGYRIGMNEFRMIDNSGRVFLAASLLL